MITRTFIKDVYETKFKEDPENNFFSKIDVKKTMSIFGVKLMDLTSTEVLHPEYKEASDLMAKKKKVGFDIKKD